MKQKGNSNLNLNLQFLFEILNKLPKGLSIRKSKEFLALSKKQQIRLGKTKRLLCKKCKILLIPKINSEMAMEKREEGFGLKIKCLNCSFTRFLIK